MSFAMNTQRLMVTGYQLARRDIPKDLRVVHDTAVTPQISQRYVSVTGR